MLSSIWIDLKLLLRVPVSVFFTLAFPPMLLTIMILSYGNVEIGGGLHFVDKYVLISIGMGMIPLTLITLPVWIGNSIEHNYMLRLRCFHVNVGRLAISNIIAHFCMGLVGIAVNLLYARIVFGLTFPDLPHLLAYLGEAIITLLVLMCVGCALGLVIKRTSILMPLGLILMFTTYMFCGGFGVFDNLPEGIKSVAAYIPAKYLMNDSFDIWSGSAYAQPKFYLISSIYLLLSLLIILIIGRTLRGRALRGLGDRFATERKAHQ